MANEAQKSKFGEFIASKKLDARRILIASHDLEKLRPEDRAIRLAKRLRDPEAKKEEGEKKKPRSGRPVTDRALAAALAGKSLTGPQKTRILRAVNKLLEQQKQAVVTLDALFLGDQGERWPLPPIPPTTALVGARFAASPPRLGWRLAASPPRLGWRLAASPPRWGGGSRLRRLAGVAARWLLPSTSRREERRRAPR